MISLDSCFLSPVFCLLNPVSSSTLPALDTPRRAGCSRPAVSSRRIFMTVAEVSGDKHAAQLIRSLRQLDPELTIEGLGGPEMADAGALVHRNTVTKAA